MYHFFDMLSPVLCTGSVREAHIRKSSLLEKHDVSGRTMGIDTEKQKWSRLTNESRLQDPICMICEPVR